MRAGDDAQAVGGAGAALSDEVERRRRVLKALSFAYERVLRLHMELDWVMHKDVRYKLAAGSAMRDARTRLRWLERLADDEG